MAFISGSAVLGSPFVINGEILGGLVVGDTNGEFTGLPVHGTNVGGAAYENQTMLRSGFPTGSIIAALNHAVESADYSGGDGIDITANAISVDLLASNPGLGFTGGKLGVAFGALGEAAIDVAGDQIAIIDANDSNATKREAFADVVTAMAGVGLAASSGVLSLDLSELTAATVDVAADSIAIVDATDGVSKKESIADLATQMAGVGIGASSGAFTLAFSELSAAVIDPANDSLPFLDATDGSNKLESVSDLVTLIAGTGTTASSNTLALNLNGLGAAAVDVANDSIAIIDADASNVTAKESIADLATAMAGTGVGASSGQFTLDLNGLSAGTIAVDADSFVFIDANDSNNSKKDAVADVVTAMAGNGLAASSGVLSLSLNGLSAAALTPSADSIAFIDADDSNASKKESVDDMVTLLAGAGVGNTSSQFVVDLNGLGAAAVDVANDSIAIIDATDNSSKKESIADLATGMAGSGVGASSGTLNIGGSNIAVFNADTLRLKGSDHEGNTGQTFKINVVGGILKVVEV